MFSVCAFHDPSFVVSVCKESMSPQEWKVFLRILRLSSTKCLESHAAKFLVRKMCMRRGIQDVIDAYLSNSERKVGRKSFIVPETIPPQFAFPSQNEHSSIAAPVEELNVDDLMSLYE